MLATQLAKPFIKFHPLESLQSNETTTTLKILQIENNSTYLQSTRESIDLRAPYWVAGSLSTVLAFLFLISQVYEAKNSKKFETTRKQFFLLNDDSDLEMKHVQNEEDSKESNKLNFHIQKLIFSYKFYKGKALAYMLAQIVLFIAGISL